MKIAIPRNVSRPTSVGLCFSALTCAHRTVPLPGRCDAEANYPADVVGLFVVTALIALHKFWLAGPQG